MTKPTVSNRSAQGAKNAIGIVLRAIDVERLAVTAERDRTRSLPGTEMRAGLLEVGVRREPESAGVLARTQHEVANEIDRNAYGRPGIGAEHEAGKRAQSTVIHLIGAHCVLDTKTVGVDQVGTGQNLAPVAPAAGDDRGEQALCPLPCVGIVPAGAIGHPQAGAPTGVEPAAEKVGVGIRAVALGGDPANKSRRLGGSDPKAASYLPGGQILSAKLADLLREIVLSHWRLLTNQTDSDVTPVVFAEWDHVTADLDLTAEILAEEARLNDLERRRDSSRRRLDELRAARDSGGNPDAVEIMESSDDWRRERKLQLFERLFQGRPDVFPKRWENAKGRSGWAPCCGNEWIPGVCEKPRVKCGECPNQAFVAPAGHGLRAHLEGHHVMGVYPLLFDDTCRLLAIDLDGRAWREDVSAIREACEELAVQPAVERSRSGQGAHVWFFFNEKVAAMSARRFGLMLLTDAMSRSPTLTMDSYDRLFPSQDVLPKGGFGNLIALPLQQEARRAGNTLFVDELLEPYADQWLYLSSLPLIEAQQLEELLADGERKSRVIAVSEDSTNDAAPWRPARPLTDRLAVTALPETVHATLAQRLYVKHADLPPPLLDALRRLACFSNPKFFELQRMRFSTARTPRVISCFEEVGDFLVLPRGCRESLEELLAGLGVELELDDERSEGTALDASFIGELEPEQTRAAEDMLGHDLGVLCAPPGSGKTVIATEMIAARARSTLVLVHRKPLLTQWKERLSQFLDVDSGGIGTIGGGARRQPGCSTWR